MPTLSRMKWRTVAMQQIDLQEYVTSAPLELSAGEHDALRAAVPSLTIEQVRGEANVYCVPKEKFIPEADRTDADWKKMHMDPITPSDPLMEIACGEGYICQIRAEAAGATGYWTHSVVHSSQYQG